MRAYIFLSEKFGKVIVAYIRSYVCGRVVVLVGGVSGRAKELRARYKALAEARLSAKHNPLK